MRVTVTGSAGFIGQAVQAALRVEGHEVKGLDRPHDVCDPDDCDQAIRGADAVIHLAGVLGTSELLDSVRPAIETNIVGTANVLVACLRHDARYVGVTVPDCWPSVYQATKLAAQRIADAYAHAYRLPVTHLRVFNAYGPGQKHGPGHPQKIIPTFASCAYSGRPLPIWGDGEQTVDLIHVEDIATAFVRALDIDCVVYDVGSGYEMRVVDVARLVCEVAGAPFVVQYLPMRAGELEHTRLCAAGPFAFRSNPRRDPRFADAVRAYGPAREAAA